MILMAIIMLYKCLCCARNIVTFAAGFLIQNDMLERPSQS